uniref:FAT domain-containing protein n=1 Tax=Heligmosomoides polygyrus TaxID=6339 RepID=A0A183FNJ5_HELPZ
LYEERRRGVCYTMPGLKSEKRRAEHTRFKDAYCGLHSFDINSSSCHLEVAVNATTVLLSQMGQGEGKAGKPSTITPLHAEIWGIRFQLLMALKLYSQLVEELQPFGELDAPDLCYQYYSESNEKTGSLIPFSMRLIHAEVLRFTPFPWKAVERVKRLELDVNKVREDTISAWHQRLTVVQKMYARVLFFLGVYIRCYVEVSPCIQTALLEAMFRMALSVGDEKAANKMLECVSKSTSTQPCLLK